MNKNSYTQVYTNISQKDLLKLLSDQIEEQLNTVKNELLELSDEELSARQEPSKWNILECIEHLNRYSAFYIPHIEAITNQKYETDKNFRSGWLGTKFTKMMSPENTKDQKTVKHMDTRNASVSKNTLHVFINWQQRLSKSCLAIWEEPLQSLKSNFRKKVKCSMDAKLHGWYSKNTGCMQQKQRQSTGENT